MSLQATIQSIYKINMSARGLEFYGHTHTPSKDVIGGVPLLCNPIGYPGENKELNFEAMFELP
jgi:hypothetical protein